MDTLSHNERSAIMIIIKNHLVLVKDEPLTPEEIEE